MVDIVIIAHNLRSSYNVGSLLRTADAMGVKKVIFTGYTPYPREDDDKRPPHISLKVDKQISKTALGAEISVDWSHSPNLEDYLRALENGGYRIVALEQSEKSIKLNDYQVPHKIALLVGREVEGIEPEILDECDDIIEIPMHGKKESLNVIQALAMALYHCRFVT